MVTRRQFLTVLAGASAGALILPRRTFFLPPPGGWRASDLSQYLTSQDAWYLPDYPRDLKYYTRSADLSEASLEEMCRQINALTDGTVMRVEPRFLIRGVRGV